ncbi:hypothetical protein OG946_29365 [Streptomyces sp. NBC_01808]|uniref:hypothetical protein n=1 Tax=Streptomyces sp. NBC_01808 TaxID=2975947 RepID=UPI002DDC7C48|nr:hypothetical protein [Streptomyces sp. NBC_01808]WSA41127.1 hypothetical protein OG946_29365 [Streptomyces sp. NBC_01808]
MEFPERPRGADPQTFAAGQNVPFSVNERQEGEDWRAAAPARRYTIAIRQGQVQR